MVDCEIHCVAHLLSCRAHPSSGLLSCRTARQCHPVGCPCTSQEASFCLSPSGEEDRDCQQGRKHWLSAAPLLVTAEVTWMSNSGSLTLQKMEGRPLTAEISYESPPYWLASCQLVHVDFACTNPSPLHFSFEILFISRPEKEYAKQNSINCVTR